MPSASACVLLKLFDYKNRKIRLKEGKPFFFSIPKPPRSTRLKAMSMLSTFLINKVAI